MQILGVYISTISKSQALEQVKSFFNNSSQKMIFTPNPEMIVEAQKDEYFREILNKGDLNICDGKGIELVSKGKVERIPGIDFMLDISNLAQNEGKSVYLLGSGSQEIVDTCKDELQKKFPLLKVVGTHPGIKIKKAGDNRIEYQKQENDVLLDHIIDVAPDILFVAFGHGKQEKWIYENLPLLPSVKVAMGVGGAFDYISGKVKRAPRLFRSLGLEWLWRLVLQPQRIGRIWNATAVFLYFYIKSNLSKKNT